MSTHPGSKKIVEAIKRLLKQKNLKYRDVAKYLKLSESTVKRFMSDEDLDLDRLMAICDLLETTLEGVLIEAKAISELRFTMEQEIFFAEHIEHLCFFLELNRGKTPSQIQSQHHLDSNSVALYLEDLQELGLLKVGHNGHPFLLASGSPVRWDDRGPIGQKYSTYFISAMCSRARDHLDRETDLALWTGSRRLSKSQWKNFREDIDRILDNYRAVSSVNEETSQEMQFMFISDLWHDPFFDTIKNRTQPETP